MIHIPTSFTLFNHNIDIIQKDLDAEENRYGYFDSARLEIYLFHRIKADNDEVITIQREQLENTLLHEVMHAIQFFSGEELSETQASTWAGLLHEFINSSGIKISPNTVHIPIEYDDESD